MELSTQVDIERSGWDLKPNSSMIMLGSCFAEKIGNVLVENKFNCVVNPFGVLYNPISVFHSLQTLLDGHFEEEKYLFLYEGLWGSWMHSTEFSSSQKAKCVQKITDSFNNAVQQLKNIDVVFLTLGTNKYYFHNDELITVANCHKCPSSCFTEKSMSMEEIVKMGADVISQLVAKNSSVRIVFTVSPYRYRKYGFHESQLSKAILLLAVDKLCKMFPENVVYFPAYEIMNDELRDYRFYGSDMLHPSEQATMYIWEKFSNAYLSADAKKMHADWSVIARGLTHIPMTDDGDKIRAFYEKLGKQIENFSSMYPFVNVDNECNFINNKLK